MSYYEALCDIIPTTGLAVPVCRDPDDDAVLDCAVNACAIAIVSGDSDLLVLNQYQTIAIVQAIELLRWFDIA